MTSETPEFTDLAVLYDGNEAKVDIVAVENIGETMRQCWTYQDEERIIWLQHAQFLPSEIPSIARIMSFGYRILSESSSNSLATELLHKLHQVRLVTGVSPNLLSPKRMLIYVNRKTDRSCSLALGSAVSFA